MIFFFFFSSRRRHTMCALVTGVQTCALPIYAGIEVVLLDRDISTAEKGKAYSSKVLGKLLEKGVTNQDKADALLADRKSVVEGRSVSVRVDMGGRRIVQKKKHKN